MQIAREILVALVVFASTNIDDIFVLLMFFADRRFSATQVIVGQYLGIGLLILISVVGALVSLVIPAAWIGLLGIFPLAIGVKKLIDLRKDEQDADAVPSTSTSTHSNIFVVATVTFSNGGDNLGVYVPLFATRSLWNVGLIVLIFLLLVGVWCVAARFLLTHRHIGNYLRRYGHVLLPFVMIALGIWILSEAWPLVSGAPSSR